MGFGNSKEFSEEYGGFETKTINDRQCQIWSTNKPHNTKQFSTLAEDWCRNPDEEAGVWCYTLDKNKRWEECPVRRCSDCDTGYMLLYKLHGESV